MSAQFGLCNFNGKLVDPRDLDAVRPVLAPYGPDAEGHICKRNFGVLYRAFHTTKESRQENQPHVTASGRVITWDGRLDNREELIAVLRGRLSIGTSDVSIIAEAYESFGAAVFSRFVGDWAMSIWDPSNESLTLVKDFVGSRHLYYRADKAQVTWCTVLDPLVFDRGRSFLLDEEYLAGWLASFPALDRTPYADIRSVPPACVVELTVGGQQVRKYWDFDPAERIRYNTDAEYEEHFRTLFAEAVRRRLRSGGPVLAELSGGMDSSSIVCMSDLLLRETQTDASRVETVSYYDQSEPNWDERPYFEEVEKQRRHTGFHIDAGAQAPSFDSQDYQFFPIPGQAENTSLAPGRFAEYVAANNLRVLLSGIGGDEMCGGVPTPIPELADLLRLGQFGKLAKALKVWALNRREPWLHLLCETVGGFCPTPMSQMPESRRPASWLVPNFQRRNQNMWERDLTRLRLFGPLPSFQESVDALGMLRRQLSWLPLPSEPTYERRYPFLDRDLLRFLFAIPPDQLVRPGHRRSLMRRALAGVIPDAVLNRRRKAFVDRRPRAAVLALWARLNDGKTDFVSRSVGIVNPEELESSIEQLRHGLEVPAASLMRTLTLESWLRSLNHVDRVNARCTWPISLPCS